MRTQYHLACLNTTGDIAKHVLFQTLHGFLDFSGIWWRAVDMLQPCDTCPQRVQDGILNQSGIVLDISPDIRPRCRVNPDAKLRLARLRDDNARGRAIGVDIEHRSS